MMRFFHSDDKRDKMDKRDKKCLKSLNKEIKRFAEYGSSEYRSALYVQRADFYVKLGRFEEAIADYNLALSLNAKNSQSVEYALGFAYYRCGNLEDAHKHLVDACNKKLKISEHNARCFYLLGVVAEAQGKQERAHKYYKRAIDADRRRVVISECFAQFKASHSKETISYIKRLQEELSRKMFRSLSVSAVEARQTAPQTKPTLFTAPVAKVVQPTQPVVSLETKATYDAVSVDPDPYPPAVPMWEKRGLEYWEHLQEMRQAYK